MNVVYNNTGELKQQILIDIEKRRWSILTILLAVFETYGTRMHKCK